MIEQSIIRKRLQTERENLTKKQQADFSSMICQQIIDSDALTDAQHIAFYLPVRGEADPTPLQTFSHHADKQFYLPILSASKKNHLEFALYNKQTEMKLNRFNIPEPAPDAAHFLIDPAKLDAVIMPMVAIDRSGNRVGMGGGFYDRTFAFKKSQDCRPQLIAFAYDFQLIDEHTPQPWDVPADAIALQNEFISV